MQIINLIITYPTIFLTQVCYEFMDKHAPEIIQHETFFQLSSCALNDLLARDSFYAPEIDIFLAVQSWVKANPGVEADTVLGELSLFYLYTSIQSFEI